MACPGWRHKNHISRTTGLTPHLAVEKSIAEASACWRPAPPPELLDLHLETHHTRDMPLDLIRAYFA